MVRSVVRATLDVNRLILKRHHVSNQRKGSCDDDLWISQIGCINGYIVCRNTPSNRNWNDVSEWHSTQKIKYLPLNRTENACSAGIDSPVNFSEAESLALKPGFGFEGPEGYIYRVLKND